ncbi:hypothetical protein TNCV_1599551 [Trichonephila clavipes]|nr:hypothetical protein TNCV_1599551 [Trichonephila clavipes]
MENLIMKVNPLATRGTSEQVKNSTSFVRAILCYHAQSGCKIYSQVSVGGTEKFRLAIARDLLDTIKVEPDFLQLLDVAENENAIESISFSEQR